MRAPLGITGLNSESKPIVRVSAPDLEYIAIVVLTPTTISLLPAAIVQSGGRKAVCWMPANLATKAISHNKVLLPHSSRGLRNIIHSASLQA
jgi:hypothetical protein